MYWGVIPSRSLSFDFIIPLNYGIIAKNNLYLRAENTGLYTSILPLLTFKLEVPDHHRCRPNVNCFFKFAYFCMNKLHPETAHLADIGRFVYMRESNVAGHSFMVKEGRMVNLLHPQHRCSIIRSLYDNMFYNTPVLE